MRGAGWRLCVLAWLLGWFSQCSGCGAQGQAANAGKPRSRAARIPASEPPRVRAARRFLARRGLVAGKLASQTQSCPQPCSFISQSRSAAGSATAGIRGTSLERGRTGRRKSSLLGSLDWSPGGFQPSRWTHRTPPGTMFWWAPQAEDCGRARTRRLRPRPMCSFCP